MSKSNFICDCWLVKSHDDVCDVCKMTWKDVYKRMNKIKKKNSKNINYQNRSKAMIEAWRKRKAITELC